MKKYFFLAGLPRAGNTLLGSLINQNSNVCLTANSILMDVLWQLEIIKRENLYFRNFPDIKSFENITKNVFNNYYADYTANKIIDRGAWGIPENLNQLKQNLTNKPKFIILYRPVLECLASFVKIEKPKTGATAEEICDYYMKNDGLVAMSLCSIKNILDNNEEYLFINYSDLVEEPRQIVKKIFHFIEEDYTDIQINDFKQFSANKLSYNDSVLNAPLHTIRTDEIVKTKTKIEDYLTPFLINKYKDLDVKRPI